LFDGGLFEVGGERGLAGGGAGVRQDLTSGVSHASQGRCAVL
jgi:hypothetical protein